MGNESDQLIRRSIISNMVIDKLRAVKGKSKAFSENLYLLDIAELGAIIFKDSKIEVWINFVDGVFEMNGGSIFKFIKLVSPGFLLLSKYFNLRSEILIDEATFPDYEVFHNQRVLKITKEDIKKYRRKIKKLIINENEIGPFIGEYETSLFSFFANIDHSNNRSSRTPNMAKKDTKNDSLNIIWMAQPKLTVKEVLDKGISLGLWNDEYQLTTTRNSSFSTGKSLLAGLYISLKGHTINENIDYKLVGKELCNFFNIPVNGATKEPYKRFQSIEPKIKKEFDKFFK